MFIVAEKMLSANPKMLHRNHKTLRGTYKTFFERHPTFYWRHATFYGRHSTLDGWWMPRIIFWTPHEVKSCEICLVISGSPTVNVPQNIKLSLGYFWVNIPENLKLSLSPASGLLWWPLMYWSLIWQLSGASPPTRTVEKIQGEKTVEFWWRRAGLRYATWPVKICRFFRSYFFTPLSPDQSIGRQTPQWNDPRMYPVQQGIPIIYTR